MSKFCKGGEKLRRRNGRLENDSPRHVGTKLTHCKYCQRTFFANRIDYHEEVCRQRQILPPRPPYDSARFRLTGTPAENYLLRPSMEATKYPINPNWKNYKEYYRGSLTMEDERPGVQPVSPFDVTTLYIQCPICGRRFNERAAERHIPNCTNHVLFKKFKASGHEKVLNLHSFSSNRK